MRLARSLVTALGPLVIAAALAGCAEQEKLSPRVDTLTVENTALKQQLHRLSFDHGMLKHAFDLLYKDVKALTARVEKGPCEIPTPGGVVYGPCSELPSKN